MAHKENGAAGARHLVHLAQAFLLKGKVAHGQHFVHQQNFRFQMGRHGKGQPRLHAAAVMLQRSVQKFGNFREGHDLVELAQDFPPLHAQNRAVQKDVLAPGQFRMESRADLEQAAHGPPNLRGARRRLGYARKNFEQSGLAGAVAADHADDFALLHLEADLAQRPNLSAFGRAVRFLVPKPRRRAHNFLYAVAQSQIPLPRDNPVALPEPAHAYGGFKLASAQSHDISDPAFRSPEIGKPAQQHQHHRAGGCRQSAVPEPLLGR